MLQIYLSFLSHFIFFPEDSSLFLLLCCWCWCFYKDIFPVHIVDKKLWRTIYIYLCLESTQKREMENVRKEEILSLYKIFFSFSVCIILSVSYIHNFSSISFSSLLFYFIFSSLLPHNIIFHAMLSNVLCFCIFFFTSQDIFMVSSYLCLFICLLFVPK